MGLLYCRAWLWSASGLSASGFYWLLFMGAQEIYLFPSLVVSVVDTSLQSMSSRTCLMRSSSWSALSLGRPLMVMLFLHLFFSAGSKQTLSTFLFSYEMSPVRLAMVLSRRRVLVYRLLMIVLSALNSNVCLTLLSLPHYLTPTQSGLLTKLFNYCQST